MAWSERQQAMLRAMGLRVWTPPAEVLPGTGPDLATAPGTPSPRATEARAAGIPEAEAMAVRAVPAPGSMPDPAPGSARAPAPAPAPAPAAPAVARLATPAAVAGLDWPSLRAAVAGCRACRLCDGRKQTVFGVGHERAHWMIVGEAPGAQEDEQGEPFVGAAGQLLDNMLRALDLSRAADGDAARRVYIANTLKCRPPGNRNPQPDEMAACEPFLLRQIELVQPRLILAMGRFAVQALLRTGDAIGKLRGRVHRYQGVPLVVTYHPAYLLRNLPDKARAWEDLCLAAGVAEQGAADR